MYVVTSVSSVLEMFLTSSPSSNDRGKHTVVFGIAALKMIKDLSIYEANNDFFQKSQFPGLGM